MCIHFLQTQIENINTPYTLSNLDLSRRYTLQLRVKGGGSCGFNESLWSDWTEAIYVGTLPVRLNNASFITFNNINGAPKRNCYFYDVDWIVLLFLSLKALLEFSPPN